MPSTAGGPPTPVKRRPKDWFRKKPPKDSKVYKAVIAYIALRAQGVPVKDISETLKLTPTTLKTYVARAHRFGWINFESFDDPEDQLEHVLKSKAVKNINDVLSETDDESGKLTNRAVDVTLEVAKGTGMLKQHQVVKSDQTSQVGVALKVQVEMPPVHPSHMPAVREGHIGGAPAINAEIIESPTEE